MFEPGDMIIYKKYIGKIDWYMKENKTYMVELYNYRGMNKVHKQIDTCELYPFNQICI